MSRLPDSLDVVLTELRLRLYRAAKHKNAPEVDRLSAMVEGLAAELQTQNRGGMKSRIRDSAQTLLDMLNMRSGHPDVSNEDAQAMWDAAFRESGFSAVKGFLHACVDVHAKEKSCPTKIQS